MEQGGLMLIGMGDGDVCGWVVTPQHFPAPRNCLMVPRSPRDGQGEMAKSKVRRQGGGWLRGQRGDTAQQESSHFHRSQKHFAASSPPMNRLRPADPAAPRGRNTTETVLGPCWSRGMFSES